MLTAGESAPASPDGVDGADILREHADAAGRVCMARLGGNAAAQSATEEALVQVMEALRSRAPELPPSEREPTVLRWVAGLGLDEVAEARRIDEDTARTRVSRGLARLRESLQGLE